MLLPPGFVPLTKVPQPPTGDAWLHEIKHDGFRVIARKDGHQVRLYSRPGNSLTDRFPLIVEALVWLSSRSCIIDGEAVCCDDNGVPSFDRLRYRRDDARVFLYAFDLIELDGDDLRRERLEVRKATLASVLRRVAPGVRLNEHIEADGPTVFVHVCKMGLEGIVSKHKLSRATRRAARRIGSRARIQPPRQCGGRQRKIGTSVDGDSDGGKNLIMIYDLERMALSAYESGAPTADPHAARR